VAAKDGCFAVDTTRIGPCWDIFNDSGSGVHLEPVTLVCAA
jgi:hypothetical protein